MDLKKLAQKPKLIQLEADSKDIIDTIGEPVVFWMKEHLDLGTYFDFYKFQEDKNLNLLTDILRKIVLDADGNPAIGDDEVLPVEVTLGVLVKINDHVGKPKAKASKETVGKDQN
jgi:hypothetical protein